MPQALRNRIFEILNFHPCIAVINSAALILLFSSFRLHLSVCALRELFKTLSFHRDRGLSDDDMQYLDDLQSKLLVYLSVYKRGFRILKQLWANCSYCHWRCFDITFTCINVIKPLYTGSL